MNLEVKNATLSDPAQIYNCDTGHAKYMRMILVVNVEATRFSGKTTALEELGFAFFLLKFLLLMLAVLFPLAVSVI